MKLYFFIKVQHTWDTNLGQAVMTSRDASSLMILNNYRYKKTSGFKKKIQN